MDSRDRSAGAARGTALVCGMFIVGLGTAAPDHCYTQSECWQALQCSPCWGDLLPRSRAILKKVLSGQNGISTRHLALENLKEAFALNPDVLHARFRRTAPALADSAARRALADAEVEPAEVDALVISTCTGYLCPGLSSYVAECLGLRPDVILLDLVGQGCGAALPNLTTGHALLQSGKSAVVLSVCVEVCSAAMYLDNDPGVLISACLFGDGAGAAVLKNKPGKKLPIRWIDGRTLLDPNNRELLRFDQKDGMLRNILAVQVPRLASKHAAALFCRVLEATGLGRSEISGWILHPGGKDVLQALCTDLQLTAGDVRWSSSVLDQYGNVSSASVFFVLEEAIRGGAPPGYWYLSSFGAGFTCHGALLQAGG